MKILTTQFTLSTRSIEIYTAGCNAPHCKGCFNPETWSFDQGDKWGNQILESIKSKINDFPLLVKNIMIFGGEPLDNPILEVVNFLTDLNTLNLPVWLFTRRELDEVPDEVKKLCNYIKCGRFDKTKKVEQNEFFGINLATSNQKIYKMK